MYHRTVGLRRRFEVACLVFACAAAARAEKPPSAERVRSAADEYDAGRRAFNDGKYDEAAVHFENAFRDAPAAAAIRNAVLARAKAGHLARAATEAALAEAKYPNDAPTREVAAAALAEAAPKLQRVALACRPACGVVADGRAVSLEDAEHVVFFLDPGQHEVVVGWGEDRTKVVPVSAKAGGASAVSLEAPPAAPKPAPPTVSAPRVEPSGSREGAPAESRKEPPSGKPLGPAVFVVGAVLAVGGGVATAISGVDTLNNPGSDKVRAACAGKGEQCPEYQHGLASQTRTNVILGATLGVGVITAVIGLFFTQWSSPKTARVAPVLEVGAASTLGLRGAF